MQSLRLNNFFDDLCYVKSSFFLDRARFATANFDATPLTQVCLYPLLVSLLKPLCLHAEKLLGGQHGCSDEVFLILCQYLAYSVVDRYLMPWSMTFSGCLRFDNSLSCTWRRVFHLHCSLTLLQFESGHFLVLQLRQIEGFHCRTLLGFNV